MAESDMLKIKQTATIEIDQIRIQNAKLWEIGAKKTDDINQDAGELGGGFDSDEEDAIQITSSQNDQEVGVRSGSWLRNIISKPTETH